MASKSAIEWTESTWNPLVGCSIVSPGCTHCYAMRTAARLSENPATPHYRGTVKTVNGHPVWTGKVALAPERVLTEPLRRKKPTMYFVNSMSDLFHESVPDEWIDKVFAVMALTPQHTDQVLTKRAERMRSYIAEMTSQEWWKARIFEDDKRPYPYPSWPLPNVWLGVSTERQQEADERIPHLLQTPAAVRFISAEPLLGAISIADAMMPWAMQELQTRIRDGKEPHHRDGKLDWVICGGESGLHARPMHPQWARDLRDQCAAAGVRFFFKQWGAWGYFARELGPTEARDAMFYGPEAEGDPLPFPMYLVGKKAAGRLLDNRTHDDMPRRG